MFWKKTSVVTLFEFLLLDMVDMSGLQKMKTNFSKKSLIAPLGRRKLRI